MRFRIAAVLLCAWAGANAFDFTVTYPRELFPNKITGRVVVYISAQRMEPRFGPSWFNPQPMYSVLVKDAKPGEPIKISSQTLGFPGKLSQLTPGEYTVQAVIDRNLGGRSIGESPGNLYSEPVRMQLNPATDNIVQLTCTKIIEAPKFQETESVKSCYLESKLLTKHYGRPTYHRAAVILPEGWELSETKQYPIIYSIPGFSGSYMDYSGRNTRSGTVRDGEQFIYVILEPNCPTGHHVFADSANNGPWGKALTTEFIPFLEEKFRAFGKAGARYVTGHSSGGWSSLWLQVTYPSVFGGCWSTSPDPVDFRDFQRINIYEKGANMFYDEKNEPRPIARFGDKPVLFFKQFSDMERPIRGEQLGSFEAVFSPRGSDGEPMKLWDRDTGAIDPTVAEAWKKYDMGLILRENHKELGPKLKGKLHVYMGNMDTFYLEGAVKLLRDDMKELMPEAKFELFPGDHGTVMTSALRRRIDKEMADAFRKWKEFPDGRVNSARLLSYYGMKPN